VCHKISKQLSKNFIIFPCPLDGEPTKRMSIPCNGLYFKGIYKIDKKTLDSFLSSSFVPALIICLPLSPV
ncbi:hypothetical protein, partial [Enterococcus hirae]|uniref:hypothetical protein n=1 Tax=Enterococcus hirae TaxID=1354 RepID=UPI001964F02A